MRTYRAHGLVVGSYLPLDDLAEGVGPVDVMIHPGRVKWLPPPYAAVSGSGWHAEATEAYLFWRDAGVVYIRQGREITVDPNPEVAEQVLRRLLLGPALAVLLHQRRRLVLHASGVAVGGRAVAFVGDSGHGKSTLAAALYARGHGILADDIAAVRVATDGPAVVFPGFPHLSLCPDALATLRGTAAVPPAPQCGMEKLTCATPSELPSAPLPLVRIDVLADGPAPRVEPLRPQEALAELVRHSYCVRLLQAAGDAAWHFQLCAAVAHQVSVCRLQRPLALAAVHDLVSLVEEDMARAVCRSIQARHPS